MFKIKTLKYLHFQCTNKKGNNKAKKEKKLSSVMPAAVLVE